MHSKNRPLQAPRPAGGFTRRVPLLSESEKARPSAFATGLCRNGSIRRSATFHRKPPCMSCTATTRCIRGSILRAGASPRYQRAKNHTQAPLRQDFVATLQSAAARFPRKPPRHAMRSYDQMHPLSPIARHILPFSASLSAWEARCDRICVQGDGRSPIASSILFRRDGHFAQVLRKSGVLLGTPAANE